MRRQLMIAILGIGLPLALSAALHAQCVQDQQQKLTAPDGTSDDLFGCAVAVSGDVVVMGMQGDDDLGLEAGSVHVYRSNGGTFVHEQKLMAADGASGDGFGHSVGVDGDRIVVGAFGDDDGAANTGSAYVFHCNGSSWIQEQKLTASDAAANDAFGLAVAIHGDVVLVGASYDDNPAAETGSAYVFRHDGTLWQQEQKLSAPDGAGLDYFGHSVDLDNDVIAVGAPLDDDGAGDSGSVYVFRYDGTSWPFEQKLTATSPDSTDYLGWSVAVDEFWVVTGAWGDDDMGTNAGAAYVFHHDGTSWAEERKFLPWDGQPYDAFGESVAADGRVVVGCVGDDELATHSGCAYLFRRNTVGWVEVGKLVAADGTAGDYFGREVAIDDRTVLVGVELDDPTGSASGSAYVGVMRDLMLDVEPEVAFEGDPITVANCGGLPGGLVLLSVIDVNGISMFVKIAIARFDAAGQWALGSTVPPGLTGLQVTLFSLGNYKPGRIGGSNLALVAFQ